MTTADKLTMLKALLGISGSTQDTLLGTYLTFSKNEIVSWRYGYASFPDVAYAEDSEAVPVTVKAFSFITKMVPTSGTSYVFTYSEDDESWQYDAADVDLKAYGIGYDTNYYTPIDGETITVEYDETPLAVFDMTQIQACVAGYSIMGAENQTEHNENGVERKFRYSDMVDYIHAHVPPLLGVV